MEKHFCRHGKAGGQAIVYTDLNIRFFPQDNQAEPWPQKQDEIWCIKCDAYAYLFGETGKWRNMPLSDFEKLLGRALTIKEDEMSYGFYAYETVEGFQLYIRMVSEEEELYITSILVKPT